MSNIALLLECYELTKNHEIPDGIQTAIENDYLKNSHLYSEDLIKCILAWLVILPESNPDFVLDAAKLSLIRRNTTA